MYASSNKLKIFTLNGTLQAAEDETMERGAMVVHSGVSVRRGGRPTSAASTEL
jgi:hypothetical protein